MSNSNPLSFISQLIAQPVRAGEVVWIGIRPKRQKPPLAVDQVELTSTVGIAGDHYQSQRNGARQVTLIAIEDIQAVASFLGCDEIAPDVLRRNIVTRGVNLAVLKNAKFRMGSALLEGSGDCAPCSRMEQALGTGGYNAMRGRGGITARILEGGAVRLRDAIVRVD